MLAEVQPWEGIRVHMLHETYRKKILPVTGRKIGPGRCWDCLDLANVCFGKAQIEGTVHASGYGGKWIWGLC